MKSRKIKTKLSGGGGVLPLELGGYYDGKHTCLNLSEKGPPSPCRGTLFGHKLYRLAKTIVKEFENDL